MKRLLTVAATAALVLLGGCSLFQNIAGSSTTTDAEKAVQVALTTYADVYQPAVLTYGHLPACPQPAGTLCHDRVTYAKLASMDQAVTASIVAAQHVLEGNVTDSGQLLATLTAVQNAEVAIAAAGIIKTH